MSGIRVRKPLRLRFTLAQRVHRQNHLLTRMLRCYGLLESRSELVSDIVKRRRQLIKAGKDDSQKQ